MMVKRPVQKCQCASSSHGHRPGKCNEFATERDALCKRCSEKTAAELSAEADIPGQVGVSIGRDAEPSDQSSVNGSHLDPPGVGKFKVGGDCSWA